MDTIGDFEDLLALLGKHRARYLIVGGLAYIYHVKPRYTKDMDLWVDATPANLDRVNRALTEFGSPLLLAPEDAGRILQIGVAPNRVDVLMDIPGVRFGTAWGRRIRDRYGSATANWICLDDLLRAKRGIDNPRHQEDVRMLRKVKQSRPRKRS